MNRGAYDNTVKKADLTTGKTASIFPAVPMLAEPVLSANNGDCAGTKRERAFEGCRNDRAAIAAAGIQCVRTEQPAHGPNRNRSTVCSYFAGHVPAANKTALVGFYIVPTPRRPASFGDGLSCADSGLLAKTG